MALCSQAFNTAGSKRSCSFTSDGVNNKKICLTNTRANTKANTKANTGISSFNKTFYSPVATSSESEEDSEDEQSCYKANQIKAKRRASTRVSFSLNRNTELSKAISKYSDDEDDDLLLPSEGKGSHDDNIDCKLMSSPANSSILLSCSNTNLSNHHNHQMLSGNNSTGNNFLQISDNSCQCLKKSIPESDKNSRSRCFEYLVSSIDEAWARYCDATTYVEDEVYGYNTPASVATDDEDYFGNMTDLTDYESDYEVNSAKQYARRLSTAISATSPTNSTTTTTNLSPSSSSSSKDPSSCQLQALKDRLTKAKYFLQDLVDSDDFNDAIAFWKRWDMVKYATIELVEDDDDDEVIESTIDELEDGRLFSN